ncbi:MAG: VOC family protein [Aggregatilineales bacterium]
MAQHAIGGVYELGIGTRDALKDVHYWQQFGYHVLDVGDLSAADAESLYDVKSALRSVRLGHQDADHGLVRLMQWDTPTNDGLGLAPMRVRGNRWSAALVEDMYNVVNHTEDAIAAGNPMFYIAPIRQQIYSAGAGRPFLDQWVGVRETFVFQPTTRQMLFERFGYSIPDYGKVNPNAHFKCSQITHFGLVVQGGDEIIDFYEEALGLLRARDHLISPYEKVKDGANVFQLQEGDSYICTDYDDPRSSASDFMAARSGRLKIIRYDTDENLPDMHAESRPGALGYALYTYRVRDIDSYHARVSGSTATDVTPMMSNEFGERSFSFIAPDGYFWTLVG